MSMTDFKDAELFGTDAHATVPPILDYGGRDSEEKHDICRWSDRGR